MRTASVRRHALGFAIVMSLAVVAPGRAADHDWSEYLGGPARACYSPLDQITAANVHRLKIAWEFRTGDPGQMQCNAIVVDGVLFGTTATNQVFALDAARGSQGTNSAATSAAWRIGNPGTIAACCSTSSRGFTPATPARVGASRRSATTGA